MTYLTKAISKVKNYTPSRYRYLLLFVTVFGSSLLLFSINKYTEISSLGNTIADSWYSLDLDIIGSDDSFTIKTKGCTIPRLLPFDESIKKFIRRPTGLRPCAYVNITLLENNDTHIWINTDKLPHYDVPKDIDVTCCYRSFFRPDLTNATEGDVADRVQYDSCINFTSSIEVTNEFVRVTCGYDKKSFYEQFFLFAFRKPVLFRENEAETSLNGSDYYNVLIIGIDAISRLNFHRTMPKTLSYLKKKGAVELLGYNKVGDNTFPNLIPMLVGIRDKDLKNICWPSNKDTLDNCPFIWNRFKDAGYYTAFGEDSASLRTFGFNGTPTDYYTHPFMYEAELHAGNNRDYNSYVLTVIGVHVTAAVEDCRGTARKREKQGRTCMSRASEGGTARKSVLMNKFKYMFLLITILTGGSIYLTYKKSIDIILIATEPDTSLESHRYEIVNSDERYTINTKGCSIPAMKPLDDSIRDIVEYPSHMKPCPNYNNSLLGYNEKRIWIKKENTKFYEITDDTLICCYQSFYRPTSIEDITSSQTDNRAHYDACLFFNESIAVTNEYVRVKCKTKKETVYEQYYAFTPEKKFIKHDNKKEIAKNKTAFNVLIMGIDAVSRLNFQRTMPKTANYLKENGAVELLGYNKVGDNTFPNLMPMLLGLKEDELKKTCLPHSKSSFDNCPFIWEWFKQAGYYTALGEDTSYLGTFNYFKMGFSRTPTDYYLHTFIHEAENNVGNNKDFNAYLCMQDKYFYKVLLDYIENLTKSLSQKKMFGFFWEVTMSHDYLNYPMVMDDDYLEFFNKLEDSNYLNNTIVFLASDHGIRWGRIRSTKQGRLEERLPFVYILTPETFRKSYKAAYNNLKVNSKRLTTPFDIHSTLTDLIDLKKLSDEAIASRSKNDYSQDRSISLFLPIPDNRTCSTVGIDDHWCTCFSEVKLSKNDPSAVNAATNLVRLLNTMLLEYPQCAKLVLSELKEVSELETRGDTEKTHNRWRDFMVVIRTTPGEAIFEATLRYDSDNWSIVGTPSRLNLYGDQSRCVDNVNLKLYCYCN